MKIQKKRSIFIVFVTLLFLITIHPLVSALLLNDLEDVDVEMAQSCNFLHYNGTFWTNYDLWNQSIIWYNPHIFLDSITANTYYGDGGNLTNVTATMPTYITSIAHPHNQDVNTTSSPTFNDISLTSYPNLDKDSTNDMTSFIAHPHNQDINTTSSPTFNDITLSLFPYLDKDYRNDMTSFIAHPHNQDLNTTSNTTFYNTVVNSINYSGTSNFDIRTTNYNTNFYSGLVNPIFTIYNTGETNIPYQSACRVRLQSDQSVPASSVTKLQLRLENYDLNDNYDTVTMRFTARKSGLYIISYSIYATGLVDRNILRTWIYVNGSPSGGHVESQVSSPSIDNLAVSGSDISYLNINDYVELYVFHNNPVAKIFLACQYSNYMAICKIA